MRVSLIERHFTNVGPYDSCGDNQVGGRDSPNIARGGAGGGGGKSSEEEAESIGEGDSRARAGGMGRRKGERG